MPLKFQQPRWRFKSPGPLSRDAINALDGLIMAIGEQGSAKDVYETFKAKFSPGSGTSSSTGFALVDMQAIMSEASSNAPRFIAAFLAGCEALARNGTDVPDLDLVNELLGEHSAGYQIIGDTLVATSESLKDLGAAVEERSVVVDVPPGALRVDGQPSEASVTSPPKMRVFLCHSSGDKGAVRKLHGELKAAGFKPWLDEEDLVGGQDWDAEIKKAVRRSHVVVVCLSKSSVNKSGYVQKEIRVALDFADEQPEGTIFIVPLRLEECDTPERLKHIHYVDLFRSNGFGKLLKALETRRATLT